MGNSFYVENFGLLDMAVQELDSIALSKAGVVGHIGYGYAETGDIGLLPGGWTARWINTQGMGNYGTLVLVPQDARSRAISREGKIRSYMDAGLTREQAARLHRARAQYKEELVHVLADVLACEGQKMALLAHPGTYGPGSGRGQWLRAWGQVFGAEGLGLSAPREAELAEMVSAIAVP